MSRTLTKRHATGRPEVDDKDENFETEGNEEDDEIPSDEDDRPGKRRKMSAGPGESVPAAPSWNKARRDRLKLALLRYGFGR
jgi:hypothetical protein